MIFETEAIDAVCFGPGSRSRVGSLRATVTGRETAGDGACDASSGLTLFQLS
jgi:hypothetical protein